MHSVAFKMTLYWGGFKLFLYLKFGGKKFENCECLKRHVKSFEHIQNYYWQPRWTFGRKDETQMVQDGCQTKFIKIANCSCQFRHLTSWNLWCIWPSISTICISTKKFPCSMSKEMCKETCIRAKNVCVNKEHIAMEKGANVKSHKENNCLHAIITR